MSKSNAFETGTLQLILQNVATHATIANLGSGLQAASTAGSLYVGLHTADPGETGDQTTNEATYTGYARIAVARSAGAWTVSADTASNAAQVLFDLCTGGSNTITDFSVGTDVSGAGNLLYKGTLTASLAVSNGITPSFPIGALQLTEE